MSENTPLERSQSLEVEVTRAKSRDRAALEAVVRSVQRDVYALALRFLWHPQDAEDATQEILIRVITGLGSFRGESDFRTWTYRVACNTLLTLRKKRMELQTISFETLGEDLEEVKIGCTMAMLLCLDRNHRLAYILGEIVELEHHEAAEVLEIAPAAFRKRLSRARGSITSFMTSRCGLANPDNACRCRRRVATAVALGRGELLTASCRRPTGAGVQPPGYVSSSP